MGSPYLGNYHFAYLEPNQQAVEGLSCCWIPPFATHPPAVRCKPLWLLSAPVSCGSRDMRFRVQVSRAKNNEMHEMAADASGGLSCMTLLVTPGFVAACCSLGPETCRKQN